MVPKAWHYGAGVDLFPFPRRFKMSSTMSFVVALLVEGSPHLDEDCMCIVYYTLAPWRVDKKYGVKKMSPQNVIFYLLTFIIV